MSDLIETATTRPANPRPASPEAPKPRPPVRPAPPKPPPPPRQPRKWVALLLGLANTVVVVGLFLLAVGLGAR